jgi:NADH pyrophosphatase NudC (nudix superfamily)
MNVLIFTNEDAQTLIEYQSGQHRLAPMQLTDGRWFLMEDILTEIPDGLFQDKLNVSYLVEPFENIQSLLPVSEETP